MPRVPSTVAAFAGLLVGTLAGEARGRRRIAAAVADTAARLERELAPPPPPSPEQRREAALLEILATRPVPRYFDPGTPVTDLLFARLEDGDQDAVAGLLTDAGAELWAASDDLVRRRLTLNFAAAFGPQEVRERSGLLSAMPPDDVHAMARGPMATGGDMYLADLVVSALGAAGMELPAGATILDFGASSGRVLRVIAAARPDLRCVGCDPNEGAIAWAAEHLPGEYFVSPTAPPLELDAGSIDVAYAISIWSHFAAEPAIAWLREMHRVVAPGGALVLTTHGWDTLATGLRRESIGPATVAAAAAALATEGHFFVEVFGEEGDWGVKDPGWGDAYLTLDWLMTQTAGSWSARLMWPGILDQSQDVIVLERR